MDDVRARQSNEKRVKTQRRQREEVKIYGLGKGDVQREE